MAQTQRTAQRAVTTLKQRQITINGSVDRRFLDGGKIGGEWREASPESKSFAMSVKREREKWGKNC